MIYILIDKAVSEITHSVNSRGCCIREAREIQLRNGVVYKGHRLTAVLAALCPADAHAISAKDSTPFSPLTSPHIARRTLEDS